MSNSASPTQSVQVEWWETRRGESFLISGELGANGEWNFIERSAWEVRWYRVPHSAELVASAEELLRSKRPLAKACGA